VQGERPNRSRGGHRGAIDAITDPRAHRAFGSEWHGHSAVGESAFSRQVSLPAVDAVRYDLSPDQVRLVLQEISKILRENPKVEDTSARVRSLRFAECALEIEIYCYILEGQYEEYLATQEELLLRIMDAKEKAGAVVALPTQTTLSPRIDGLTRRRRKRRRRQLKRTAIPACRGLRRCRWGLKVSDALLSENVSRRDSVGIKPFPEPLVR
jgi:hypothetical protein